MGGICGVYNRNGEAAGTALVEQMMAAAPARGRDGAGTWQGQGIALGRQQLATTSPASAKPGPSRDEAADLTLVFHGRLDAREHLSAQLQCGAGDCSDEVLVLSAYRRWGEGCFARLLGDFALAIWDGRRQVLLAARDIVGIKPFYYYLEDRRLVFASEQAQVLRHPALSREVNETVIGEYLLLKRADRSETLYRDIQRLPPGHYLRVSGREAVVSRYWHLRTGNRLHYARPEQYVEQFLDLLRQSVADRLRTTAKAGIYLSGGIDSPAVAAMAAGVARERGDDHDLRAYSVVLDHPDCIDESENIRRVARHCAIPSQRFRFKTLREQNWAALVRDTQELPLSPVDMMNAPLREAASHDGVRVMLTGSGADTWFGGGNYPYFELLRALEIGALIDELRCRATSHGWAHVLRALFRSLTWPLLPDVARAAVERHRSLMPREHHLSAKFTDRVDFEQRLHLGDAGGGAETLTDWQLLTYGFRGNSCWGLEAEELRDSRASQEQRHPFYDRRLIEFAAALPQNLKCSGGENKLLLRRSGLHPGEVLASLTNADFGIAGWEVLKLESVRSGLARLQLAEAGWVDQARVCRELTQVSQGPPDPERRFRAMFLWQAFALDQWYRVAIIDSQ